MLKMLEKKRPFKNIVFILQQFHGYINVVFHVDITRLCPQA